MAEYHSSVAEGVDGGISGWVADERSRVLGLELSLEEEERRADLVRAAKTKQHWMHGRSLTSSSHE